MEGHYQATEDDLGESPAAAAESPEATHPELADRVVRIPSRTYLLVREAASRESRTLSAQLAILVDRGLAEEAADGG